MPHPSPLLGVTRSRLGPAPRDLASLDQAARRPAAPHWLSATDGLWPCHHDFEEYLTDGALTWGCIVKANNVLWQDGHQPSAVLLIHGVDPSADPSPSELEVIARRLAAMRGQRPRDPAWLEVARIVGDDSERTARHPVPASLAPGPRTALSAALVWPHQLPLPRLACVVLPLLLHPRHPCPVVLPQALWPDELRSFWLAWDPL